MSDNDYYRQLITWGLRRQTTWAALMLTFLTASLQLFFHIQLYDEQYGIWSILLSWLIVFLHIVFSFGFLFCIHRFFQLYKIVNNWEQNIENEILSKGIEIAAGWYHGLFRNRYFQIITLSFFSISWIIFIFFKLIVENLLKLP